MRLWHEALIPELPRQQLLGQHRECCALRGNGWGKSHRTVNYVFQYAPVRLYQYHQKVMDEMKARGFQVDPLWEDPLYRGRNCTPYREWQLLTEEGEQDSTLKAAYIYPEHDCCYFRECLENLKAKGISLLPPPERKDG
ncbi:TIGR02328 family protein [Bacillus piscicola]|uniref:TIGR02328 family protein n=1 Tax=Bacillus piscicola TaxID=1632684 RepID=UPI001F08E584|nr:TIGR02328 family protein [Bacillus piscicola]